MPPICSRSLLLALALSCAACVSSDGRVRLDHYGAVVATHFGGIPAGAVVCAALRNEGDTRVDWVKLRLISESRGAARTWRFTSQWVYRGAIESGATLALELPGAPPADRMELELRGAGRGEPPRGARDARPAGDCSELWLHAQIAAEAEARPDAEVDSLAVATPEPPDGFIADGDGP